MKSDSQEINYSDYDEELIPARVLFVKRSGNIAIELEVDGYSCLLYTSDAADE